MEKALSASQKVLICRQTALQTQHAESRPVTQTFATLPYCWELTLAAHALRLSQEFTSWSPKRPNKKDHVMVYVELGVARWQRTPDPPLPLTDSQTI